jgi:hypothetical protein
MLKGLIIYVCIYCDMTPECQKCAVREALQRCPLLDNGSLTHVSAAMDRLVETKAFL